jgi:hypothetical protein
MKHIGWLAAAIAVACGLAACSGKTTPPRSAPAPGPTAPLSSCPGELAFADDAASFSLVSEECGVALRNATVRLLVNNGDDALELRAADYPSRAVEETDGGWRWSLSGLGKAPSVEVDFTAAESGDAITLRARLTRDVDNGRDWQVRWAQLPYAADAGGGVEVPGPEGRGAWVQNGHDSWTFTGVEQALNLERPPQTINGAPYPCADNYDYVSTCSGISWWFGAVGSMDYRPGLLWGALAARSWKTYAAGWYDADEQPIHLIVTQGTPDDSRRLAAGTTLELEPIWLTLAARVPYDLRRYAEAVAAEVPPLPPVGRAPFGWGTWYQYFSDIDAATLLDNCARLKQLYPDEPDMVCQLDDGYETRFGDWTDYTAGFPDGLAPVAQAIAELGLRPGLWMAPLLVDARSELIVQHPGWFLFDRAGAPIVWKDPLSIGGSSYYLLDVTVPDAAAHIADVISQRAAEGFTYFKFDFLFGGSFEGAYADGSTAMEAYHQAMALFRQAAGDDAYIVACGAPWLPTVGHAHAARGSSDVAGSFPGVPLFTTMANLGRYHGVRAFANEEWFAYDPDNLVVRSPLTDFQAQVSIAMTWMSGSTLLGDGLLDLSPARTQLLLSDGAEELRTATGRFWASDLLAEAVPWPIATPAFDLIGWANAPPKVWVRGDGDERLVALFAWGIAEEQIAFDDFDLAVDLLNGVDVARVFGAEEATLERHGATGWLATVPAQSVAVYRFVPTL